MYSLEHVKHTFMSNWKILILVVAVIAVAIAYAVFRYRESFASVTTYVTTKAAELRQKITGTNKWSKLTDLDLILFASDTCPHCRSLITTLQKDNSLQYFNVIDVNTDEGKQLYGQFKIQGVPTTISTKLQKSVLGTRSSTEELINALMTSSPAAAQGSLAQGSPIYIFGTSSCPWCVKAKEEAQPPFKFVNKDSPEGQSLIAQYNIQIGSIPHTFNPNNGKSNVGYLPRDQLLAKVT